MKYIFLIVFGFGLILSSCDKFLEEVPTDRLTTDAQITSLSGGIALATGCYRNLNQFCVPAVAGQVNTACGFEYPTGKAYINNGTAGHGPYLTNSVDGEEFYSDFWWRVLYAGVKDCNLAIEQIPGVTLMPDDQKSQALGEAHTLRAWYYFNLVRYYGDVPMNSKIFTNIEEAYLPRSSVKNIYDKIIIPDLEFAVNESKLADIQSSNGRVTKYTARLILADVYLTCAGYPYQEITDTTVNYCTEGLWSATTYPVNNASAIAFLQKAKTQLDALYGKFTLGTYDDLHDPAKNNKGEAIFQVQFVKGVVTNTTPWLILPQMANCHTQTGGNWEAMNVQLGYYNSYSAGDKRKQERQYFFTSDTWAANRDPSEPPDLKFNSGYPYMFKFYDYKAMKGGDNLSDLNWTLYRYADVLLLLTEVNYTLSSLGQSVPDFEILKGINEIRRRALMPEYVISDINLLTIFSERAYELLFESKMLWDMRRTRKALVNGSGSFAAIENLVGHFPDRSWKPDYCYNHAIDKHELLQPIPKREIDNNPKVFQNYGYNPKQVGQ